MATLCREVVDDCDLGEYCDGVSEFCPSDAYVADGTDCKADEVCVFVSVCVCQVVFLSVMFAALFD